MEVKKALDVFGFKSIDDLTEENLKKAYRKLMKKYHPDLYTKNNLGLEQAEFKSKQINEANETLGKLLVQIESFKRWEQATRKEEIFTIIPFESLFSIYSGESIELHDSNGTFLLTKGNLRAHRIILCINCSITYNNVTHNYSELKPAILKDEYEIECAVPVIDDSPLDIAVNAYGKNLNITLKNKTTRLRLKFEHSIDLILNIQKRLIQQNQT